MVGNFDKSCFSRAMGREVILYGLKSEKGEGVVIMRVDNFFWDVL